MCYSCAEGHLESCGISCTVSSHERLLSESDKIRSERGETWLWGELVEQELRWE